MSTRLLHRVTFYLSAALAVVILAASSSIILKQFPAAAPFARAQSSSLGCLSGDAWSDNIGWIDFQCPNVTVQNDGTITGAAWANPSDDVAGTNNIGWISFNSADTASCGTGGAKITGTALSGWAKAIAADNNGWDGCISLSGSSPAYGVTLPGGTGASGDLAGNAWGSDVVGWISFNCNAGGATQNNICATSNYKVTFTTTAQPPPPQAITNFFANPTRVRRGGTSTLYYTVATPPASCTITGNTSTTTVFSANVSPIDGVRGTVATNAISANTNFTITCGGVSASVNVGIVPTYQEQ
jgi:hypothetical protein